MTAKYVLDSNIYIDFYDRYYSIHHFPSFWKQVPAILNGQVIIPKVVLDEHYQDPWFKSWLSKNCQNPIVDERNYISEWQQVLNYLTQNPFYKDEAVSDPGRGWANSFIADGWLIAIALKDGLTIVTDELRNPNLTATTKGVKNAKIPDVCDHFGVRFISREDFFGEIGLSV